MILRKILAWIIAISIATSPLQGRKTFWDLDRAEILGLRSCLDQSQISDLEVLRYIYHYLERKDEYKQLTEENSTQKAFELCEEFFGIDIQTFKDLYVPNAQNFENFFGPASQGFDAEAFFRPDTQQKDCFWLLMNIIILIEVRYIWLWRIGTYSDDPITVQLANFIEGTVEILIERIAEKTQSENDEGFDFIEFIKHSSIVLKKLIDCLETLKAVNAFLDESKDTHIGARFGYSIGFIIDSLQKILIYNPFLEKFKILANNATTTRKLQKVVTELCQFIFGSEIQQIKIIQDVCYQTYYPINNTEVNNLVDTMQPLTMESELESNTFLPAPDDDIFFALEQERLDTEHEYFRLREDAKYYAQHLHLTFFLEQIQANDEGSAFTDQKLRKLREIVSNLQQQQVPIIAPWSANFEQLPFDDDDPYNTM